MKKQALILLLFLTAFLVDNCPIQPSPPNLLQITKTMLTQPSVTQSVHSYATAYSPSAFATVPAALTSITQYKCLSFSQIEYSIYTHVNANNSTLMLRFMSNGMKWGMIGVRVWLIGRPDMQVYVLVQSQISNGVVKFVDVAIKHIRSKPDGEIDNRRNAREVAFINSLIASSQVGRYEVSCYIAAKTDYSYTVAIRVGFYTSVRFIKIEHVFLDLDESACTSRYGQYSTSLYDDSPVFIKINENQSPFTHWMLGFDMIDIKGQKIFTLNMDIDKDYVLQISTQKRINYIRAVYLAIRLPANQQCSKCSKGFYFQNMCVQKCPSYTYSFHDLFNGKICLACSAKVFEKINPSRTGCVCMKGYQRDIQNNCIQIIKKSARKSKYDLRQKLSILNKKNKDKKQVKIEIKGQDLQVGQANRNKNKRSFMTLESDNRTPIKVNYQKGLQQERQYRMMPLLTDIFVAEDISQKQKGNTNQPTNKKQSNLKDQKSNQQVIKFQITAQVPKIEPSPKPQLQDSPSPSSKSQFLSQSSPSPSTPPDSLCDSSSIRYEDMCITCPDGTFKSSNNYCEVCQDVFKNCLTCNATSCLLCEDKFVIKGAICLCEHCELKSNLQDQTQINQQIVNKQPKQKPDENKYIKSKQQILGEQPTPQNNTLKLQIINPQQIQEATKKSVPQQQLTLPPILNTNETNTSLNPKCQNSIVQSPESCDDGNGIAGDGCSPTCTIQNGYMCSNSSHNSTCIQTLLLTQTQIFTSQLVISLQFLIPSISSSINFIIVKLFSPSPSPPSAQISVLRPNNNKNIIHVIYNYENGQKYYGLKVDFYGTRGSVGYWVQGNLAQRGLRANQQESQSKGKGKDDMVSVGRWVFR